MVRLAVVQYGSVVASHASLRVGPLVPGTSVVPAPLVGHVVSSGREAPRPWPLALLLAPHLAVLALGGVSGLPDHLGVAPLPAEGGDSGPSRAPPCHMSIAPTLVTTRVPEAVHLVGEGTVCDCDLLLVVFPLAGVLTVTGFGFEEGLGELPVGVEVFWLHWEIGNPLIITLFVGLYHGF